MWEAAETDYSNSLTLQLEFVALVNRYVFYTSRCYRWFATLVSKKNTLYQHLPKRGHVQRQHLVCLLSTQDTS
jgi:hypothetical protein